MSDDISRNLDEIKARIARACARCGRDPDTVELVAVSKFFPADAVRSAHDSGQIIFGESRLQEAQEKIPQLPDDLHWHFIGRLQKNKVRKTLPLFRTIHSIDSLSLAEAVNRIAAEDGFFPQVYLQTNLAEEESKTGFTRDQLLAEFDRILDLERLKIIGLMAIPPTRDSEQQTRADFIAVRELRDQLTANTDLALPGLSMGMSGDFETAIEEGATIVRVGSAIFGERS